MPDAYAAVRAIPFPALCSALGIDHSRFKLRAGKQEYYGRCPLHDAKANTTSFSYHEDGRYHCFSCEAKGKGAIDFTRAIRQCGFKEAVAFLEGLNVQPQAKSPAAVNSDATDGVLKPYTGKYEKFKVPCPWLEARIPDAAVRERYGVFCYDNPNRKSAYSGRVMIPFKDIQGNLFGYLGRAVASGTDNPSQTQDTPKYLIPSGFPKSKFAFGVAEIRAGMFGPLPLRYVYLVESPFAVMRFAMYGLPALSPFGWHVSDEQVSALCSLARGVVYLPDRNKTADAPSIAGRLSTRLWTRSPELPAGIDDPEQLDRASILSL